MILLPNHFTGACVCGESFDWCRNTLPRVKIQKNIKNNRKKRQRSEQSLKDNSAATHWPGGRCGDPTKRVGPIRNRRVTKRMKACDPGADRQRPAVAGEGSVSNECRQSDTQLYRQNRAYMLTCANCTHGFAYCVCCNEQHSVTMHWILNNVRYAMHPNGLASCLSMTSFSGNCWADLDEQ